jgi:hypothetical protein
MNAGDKADQLRAKKLNATQQNYSDVATYRIHDRIVK